MTKSSRSWRQGPDEYIRQLDLNKEYMEVHNRSCILIASEMFFIESKVTISKEIVLSTLYQLLKVIGNIFRLFINNYIYI